MGNDPFSAVLSLVDAQAVCAGGFTVGGAWAIAFPPPEQLKFFVIARGRCWLAVEGLEAPLRMTEGDALMLAAPRSFVAFSDPAVPPRPARELFAGATSGIFPLGGGDEMLFLGGHVDMAAGCGSLLLDGLPDVIHIGGNSTEAPRLASLIVQLAEECGTSREGADFACKALAQLIFLQILRVHLARHGDLAPGMLRVLADRRLAPALRLMHAEPARNWHLPELASAAAMSRTAFATRFKALAGMAPLAYLAHWRLRLAQRWLSTGTMTISQVARATGFGSESAFSNAFKRTTGVSPSQFRSMSRLAAE
ncbi:AraC family transcriptional regulator [Azospirillum picis]|uniref:AraC-like DNA-binding protein n=1 Tax=Azospirillum picis TaxID=488438 RepID=A0ABU0MT72_9PROT|nr:AraC family transcriptional regulator [Azospirillum picis]MBP2301965.1 AraC-like DNA-binding protein [Azospirillum picis]MDQ0536414.1 AraC-like DNA-binding protein [Azospirillum picis]